MPSKSNRQDKDRQDRVVRDARLARQQREQGYRERALKLFPWICARCGREFSGRRLRELTVHHRDHNHDNNPPDGSNWELLCLYCHDNEHSRYLEQEWQDPSLPGDAAETPAGDYRPFAGLGDLLKNNK